MLFFIYINDLEENIKPEIRLFAVDTMLFSVVKDPDTSANELNPDLKSINHRVHQRILEFNPDLTKQAIELLFSYQTIPPTRPIYF